MKVYVKNKMISLRGNSDVLDENQNPIYKVKGRLFSFTRRKRIMNLEGKVLYKVRNKWPKIFTRAAYIKDENGDRIAKVYEKFFALKKIIVKGYKDEITIGGELFSPEFQIVVNGQVRGTVKRGYNITLTDTYELDAPAEDIPFMIALVVAMDNIYDNVK